MGEVTIVFIVIGLPVLLAFAMVGYRMWLQHRQIQLLLDERRLLIEQGRDLPELKLPEMTRHKGDRLRNLKAGLVLLFVAAGLFVCWVVQPGEPFLDEAHVPIMAILAALGLGFVLIQVVTETYEGREKRADDQNEAGEEQAEAGG